MASAACYAGWVIAQALCLISVLGTFGGMGLSLGLGLLLGVVPPILFLVLEPYKHNRNIKFHAFQGLFVSGAILALWLILRIFAEVILGNVGSLVTVDPVTGHVGYSITFHIFRVLTWIYAGAPLALCAILTLKAFNNQKWVLPVVGPLAEKQAYK
jgi:uncharacterized membrane protein